MICYIEQNYCECGAFQAYKYSCSHVIVVCAHVNINRYQYMDKVYKIKTTIQGSTLLLWVDHYGNWNSLGCKETIPERS